MQLEKIKMSEIKPYEGNAKLHPDYQVEQIKKSIEEFGYNDPIAIDENNVIIEGHGRYLALTEMKKPEEEIEVLRLNGLNEEQKKAYMLVHNKLTMNTDFDLELLQDELDDIMNIDMNDFGFENVDLFEDEFEDINDENLERTEGFDHVLRIDNKKIIMTEEEYQGIIKRLNEYLEINGVSFGFIKSILEG